MTIQAKAYAKINWSLRVAGKRPDGYHELDMLMQPIELHDVLTFAPSDALALRLNGMNGSADDLVMRAARALQAETGTSFGAKMTLSKRIPSRAGLGGGSADCATALLSLNRLWRLGLPFDALMRIGAELGADVPFCLKGYPCRVRGIGEKLTPMRLAPRVPLVMVFVGEGLSTAEVFKLYDADPDAGEGRDPLALAQALREGALRDAAPLSENALEKPAIALLPGIRTAMERLRALGADYVRMSGSGSVVYGAFSGESRARQAAARLPASILTYTRTENSEA